MISSLSLGLGYVHESLCCATLRGPGHLPDHSIRSPWNLSAGGMGCLAVRGNFIFHLMGLFTEMVQGFKELKAETDVLEFINKPLNCAVKEQIRVPRGSTPALSSSCLYPTFHCLCFENSILLLVFNETRMFIIFDGRLSCLQLKVMLFCPQTDSAGSLFRFFCIKMTPKFLGHEAILHFTLLPMR